TIVSPSYTPLSFFFFQAEDGIRDRNVTGVQTCALPIYSPTSPSGTSSPNSLTTLFSTFTMLMPIDPGTRSFSIGLKQVTGEASDKPYPSETRTLNFSSKLCNNATGNEEPPEIAKRTVSKSSFFPSGN